MGPADEPLYDARTLGDVLHPAELGRVVADAVPARDEEHDGGEVGCEDGTVVKGAGDGDGQIFV